MRNNALLVGLILIVTVGLACSSRVGAPGVAKHVIEIDIDDHGLAGLEMANAPNLKGLIARGTLAYTRVIIPTHSNQSNMALLTAQYPDGNNVPANSWLARDMMFLPPVNLPGLPAGDYARYDRNPLLTRGDSAYRAVARLGLGATAFVGELPPFEAGAGTVWIPVVGAHLGSFDITKDVAVALLQGALAYPKAVVDTYQLRGPPAAGESFTTFTMREAAEFIRATNESNAMPAFMFVWDFIALDEDPTSASGASGPDLVKVVEEYDAGIGGILAALDDMKLTDSTNILFTLDQGKVDTRNQVVLGTRGVSAGAPADGQLGALVTAQGGALGITTADYALLNEDGDAQIYARVAGAGMEAGAARQAEVTHALLTLIQGGGIAGLDTTRTMTADGALGTRKFHDYHASGPNQADIIVFPQDNWTLNQVDATNTAPGPFMDHTQYPFGRHGGFSVDELYVPLIMAGPSFKRGVLIPHPVEHPQVPVTALATLGGGRLDTASVPLISAALASSSGETMAQPGTLAAARDLVLQGSGYAGAPALAGTPASAAVLVDLAAVYDEEVFSDEALAAAARPIRDLASQGTRFLDFWTRSRDWPVTEYEMLVGGYPAATPWIPAAEDDPSQTVLPGPGLLQMPPAAGFIANRSGYDAWRGTQVFAEETLFDAARALGATTALVGQPDFHALHIPAVAIDVTMPATPDQAAGVVGRLLAQHPRLLAVVALGAARAGDRHGAKAKNDLAALASAVSAIRRAAPGALLIVTSRGATTIDDPTADAYGAGSSRHVPFVVVGPNVRAKVLTSQPAVPADLPATVLFGLGAAVRSDFVDGTWAAGTAVGGIAQPTPKHATAGHALLRAYELR